MEISSSCSKMHSSPDCSSTLSYEVTPFKPFHRAGPWRNILQQVVQDGVERQNWSFSLVDHMEISHFFRNVRHHIPSVLCMNMRHYLLNKSWTVKSFAFSYTDLVLFLRPTNKTNFEALFCRILIFLKIDSRGKPQISQQYLMKWHPGYIV